MPLHCLTNIVKAGQSVSQPGSQSGSLPAFVVIEAAAMGVLVPVGVSFSVTAALGGAKPHSLSQPAGWGHTALYTA